MPQLSLANLNFGRSGRSSVCRTLDHAVVLALGFTHELAACTGIVPVVHWQTTEGCRRQLLQTHLVFQQVPDCDVDDCRDGSTWNCRLRQFTDDGDSRPRQYWAASECCDLCKATHAQQAVPVAPARDSAVRQSESEAALPADDHSRLGDLRNGEPVSGIPDGAPPAVANDDNRPTTSVSPRGVGQYEGAVGLPSDSTGSDAGDASLAGSGSGSDCDFGDLVAMMQEWTRAAAAPVAARRTTNEAAAALLALQSVAAGNNDADDVVIAAASESLVGDQRINDAAAIPFVQSPPCPLPQARVRGCEQVEPTAEPAGTRVVISGAIPGDRDGKHEQAVPPLRCGEQPHSPPQSPKRRMGPPLSRPPLYSQSESDSGSGGDQGNSVRVCQWHTLRKLPDAMGIEVFGRYAGLVTFKCVASVAGEMRGDAMDAQLEPHSAGESAPSPAVPGGPQLPLASRPLRLQSSSSQEPAVITPARPPQAALALLSSSQMLARPPFAAAGRPKHSKRLTRTGIPVPSPAGRSTEQHCSNVSDIMYESVLSGSSSASESDTDSAARRRNASLVQNIHQKRRRVITDLDFD